MAPLADDSEDNWHIVNKLEEENYNLRVQAQKLQVALSKCGRQTGRGGHVSSSQSDVSNSHKPCVRTDAKVAQLVEEKLNIALEGIGELAGAVHETQEHIQRLEMDTRRIQEMVSSNGCSLRSQSQHVGGSGLTGETSGAMKQDTIDVPKKPTKIEREPRGDEFGNDGDGGDLWTASFLNGGGVELGSKKSNVGTSDQDIVRGEGQKSKASSDESPVVLKKSEVDFIWREIQELQKKVKNAETEMSRRRQPNVGEQEMDSRPILVDSRPILRERDLFESEDRCPLERPGCGSRSRASTSSPRSITIPTSKLMTTLEGKQPPPCCDPDLHSHRPKRLMRYGRRRMSDKLRQEYTSRLLSSGLSVVHMDEGYQRLQRILNQQG